jgi:ATP-binding cassette, subfamily B, bacterial MsbA
MNRNEVSPLRTTTALTRILRQAWPYRWLIVLTLLSAAGSAGLFGFLLLVMDALFRSWSTVQAHSGDSATVQAAVDEMHRLAGHLLILAPLMAGCSYLSVISGQRLANACMRDLRQQFLGHLLELDLGFHVQASRGDLMTRMMHDLNSMFVLQSRLYGKAVQRPLEIVAIIGAIAWIDWRLGTLLLTVMIPLSFVLVCMLARARRRGQRARQDLSKNLGIFEQIVSGIRVIKTMGSAEHEKVRFAATNDRLYASNMKVASTKAGSEATAMGFIFVLIAGALFLGGWLFQGGWAEPAALLVLFGGLGRLAGAMRELQRLWGHIQTDLPGVERIYAVLDRQPSLQDTVDAQPYPAPQQAIRLHHVSFRYAADQEDVLRDISIDIPVGQTIALVGPSGGGKSTLLDLLPRMYDVSQGAILWDDQDVRHATRASLVHHCAIVQQHPFLFDGTVMENIRYGRPDASDDEVFAAAHRANVHDDILALEGGRGYDSPVGDDGGRLSGGQRQRISIARALLRNAPLLLMDEPTSALDSQSEGKVQAALAELMQNRTTVIVAHRLATIQHADRIYVLGGKHDGDGRGRIIESGNHQELMIAGGHYAAMVRAQELGD